MGRARHFTMKRLNLSLSALVLINFLLRLFVAVRPLKYIDGLTIPDDAYLALTIARNIAGGLGPLYSLDYTNGFQPLYVFLMVPVYWLFPRDLIMPVHISLVILTLFDTATLYLIYKLVSRFTESTVAPLFAAAAWIFNPAAIRTANNGLETSISMFFIVLTYFFYRKYRLNERDDKSWQTFLAFGMIVGLAMLARIDNIILLCAFLTDLIISSIRNRRLGLLTISRAFLIVSGAAIVYLPWLAYSHHYTGGFIPISGQAVRFMSLSTVNHASTWANWYSFSLSEAINAVARGTGIYLAVIVLLSGLIFLQQGRNAPGLILSAFRPHNSVLIYSLALFVSYAFIVFGTGYFSRYLYPITFLVILYLASIVGLFEKVAAGGKLKIISMVFVGALIILSSLLRPGFRALYFSHDTTSSGYMNLGLWARDTFPDGTTIGSSQTGALGYFANNLRVINLDGVVNKKCFESLQQRRNMEYIRDTGIEYVVGWTVNFDFIKRESSNFKQDDLILVNKINGFQSWWNDWYLYKVNYARARQ